MCVDGHPIPRNQNIVTRAIAEREKVVLYLFNSPEGFEER